MCLLLTDLLGTKVNATQRFDVNLLNFNEKEQILQNFDFKIWRFVLFCTEFLRHRRQFAVVDAAAAFLM